MNEMIDYDKRTVEHVYHPDFVLVDEFHDKVYDGLTVTDEEVAAAHAAWWRCVNREIAEPTGSIVIFATLLYAKKYLPETGDPNEYLL